MCCSSRAPSGEGRADQVLDGTRRPGRRPHRPARRRRAGSDCWSPAPASLRSRSLSTANWSSPIVVAHASPHSRTVTSRRLNSLFELGPGFACIRLCRRGNLGSGECLNRMRERERVGEMLDVPDMRVGDEDGLVERDLADPPLVRQTRTRSLASLRLLLCIDAGAQIVVLPSLSTAARVRVARGGAGSLDHSATSAAGRAREAVRGDAVVVGGFVSRGPMGVLPEAAARSSTPAGPAAYRKPHLRRGARFAPGDRAGAGDQIRHGPDRAGRSATTLSSRVDARNSALLCADLIALLVYWLLDRVA